jgi:D-glycero-D-manno-heptose 1,7-bisphosphate phosphatase
VPAESPKTPTRSLGKPPGGFPAVFLDRDGTLNAAVVRDGQPFPPGSVDEFVLLPGVAEGCARLKSAGYRLIVATNQPDVGRGTQTQAAVEGIHAKLVELLPVDRVEVSYDSGRENPPSPFRKPAPGMLLRAAKELGLDLTHSWMVGDRWRDVDCGKNAGCQTVFIDGGCAEKLQSPPDFIVQSFADAVNAILAQCKTPDSATAP